MGIKLHQGQVNPVGKASLSNNFTKKEYNDSVPFNAKEFEKLMGKEYFDKKDERRRNHMPDSGEWFVGEPEEVSVEGNPDYKYHTVEILEETVDPIHGPQNDTVATLEDDTTTWEMANYARLIAAAPDMLAYIKRLNLNCPHCIGHPLVDSHSRSCEDRKTLIAKIEGKIFK